MIQIIQDLVQIGGGGGGDGCAMSAVFLVGFLFYVIVKR